MKSTNCIIFQELFPRPLIAQFTEEQISSDGGAILLQASDKRLGLMNRIATVISDKREPGKIAHTMKELISQRVYGIACGYSDANDSARLSEDPVFKLLAKNNLNTANLASQSTLSRFENSMSRKDIYRLGDLLADIIIDRHRKRLGNNVKRITIDMDVTDDPTHGEQQLTFFNGYYKTYCYLPLYSFITFNDEAEQFPILALLRPGNASPTLGVLPVLQRTVKKLRSAFPKTKLRVRLDGGFAFSELFNYLESQQRMEYVISLPKNSVLKTRAERLMKRVRRQSKKSGKTEKIFSECVYSARKWKKKLRRVIIKSEVTIQEGREPKDNPRFVVTNLKQSPKFIYEKIYCKRGEVENRLKEFQFGLNADRTSCTSFLANQFRLLLTQAAYLLLQEIRLNATDTSLKRAQVARLILDLFKIGVRVVSSVRRIVFNFPSSFPYRETWEHIAISMGANTT